MPDCSIATQAVRPSSANSRPLWILLTWPANMIANAASATASALTSTELVNTTAITISATKSSTTATVRMKARRLSGKRRPTMASMPRANAVSVDMAAPQPPREDAEPLMAR